MEWSDCAQCGRQIYDKYARYCDTCASALNREALDKKRGRSFAELTSAEQEALLEISKESGDAALKAFWREYGKNKENEMTTCKTIESAPKPDILKNLENAHKAA
ncbi:hypothetical protein, partial [Candidatus Tokpelaia sp.]|uniref:hypothetical protein n=1 Tax=Candidatus Tokpelaia sp. TaxID=2233777 RepID=UPI00126B1B98